MGSFLGSWDSFLCSADSLKWWCASGSMCCHTCAQRSGTWDPSRQGSNLYPLILWRDRNLWTTRNSSPTFSCVRPFNLSIEMVRFKRAIGCLVFCLLSFSFLLDYLYFFTIPFKFCTFFKNHIFFMYIL